MLQWQEAPASHARIKRGRGGGGRRRINTTYIHATRCDVHMAFQLALFSAITFLRHCLHRYYSKLSQEEQSYKQLLVPGTFWKSCLSEHENVQLFCPMSLYSPRPFHTLNPTNLKLFHHDLYPIPMNTCFLHFSISQFLQLLLPPQIWNTCL